MKKLLFLFLILSNSLYSQNQYGIIAETNWATIKTNDLYGIEVRTGYGYGVSNLTRLWNTADLNTEVSVITKRMKIKGYVNYENEKIEFDNPFFKIIDIHANLLLNQYIIAPDRNKIHLAMQTGLGLALLKSWKNNGDIAYHVGGQEATAQFLAGISTGTEQLRISLRYSAPLSNVFKGYYVVETAPLDESNIQRREYKGKLSYISLSLSYYFDLFK